MKTFGSLAILASFALATIHCGAQQLRYYNQSPAPQQRQYTPAPQLQSYSASNRYAPVPNAPVNAPYFDPTYPQQYNRQHYGIDYGTRQGQPIYPSNQGYIVNNNTGYTSNPSEQRVIVQHPGYQAVYGHVVSPLPNGAYISPGQQIGVTNGGHLHYGENVQAVPQSGWGRGPANSTPQQAAQQGWYNPQPGWSR